MPTSNESTAVRRMSSAPAICIDTGLPIGDRVVRQSELRRLKKLEEHILNCQAILAQQTEELRSEVLSGAKIQRGKLRWNPDLGCVTDDSHRADTSAS